MSLEECLEEASIAVGHPMSYFQPFLNGDAISISSLGEDGIVTVFNDWGKEYRVLRYPNQVLWLYAIAADIEYNSLPTDVAL